MHCAPRNCFKPTKGWWKYTGGEESKHRHPNVYKPKVFGKVSRVRNWIRIWHSFSQAPPTPLTRLYSTSPALTTGPCNGTVSLCMIDWTPYYLLVCVRIQSWQCMSGKQKAVAVEGIHVGEWSCVISKDRYRHYIVLEAGLVEEC